MPGVEETSSIFSVYFKASADQSIRRSRSIRPLTRLFDTTLCNCVNKTKQYKKKKKISALHGEYSTVMDAIASKYATRARDGTMEIRRGENTSPHFPYTREYGVIQADYACAPRLGQSFDNLCGVKTCGVVSSWNSLRVLLNVTALIDHSTHRLLRVTIS